MVPSLMLVTRDTRGINREEWETPPEIIIRVKPLYSNDRVPMSRLFHEDRGRNEKEIHRTRMKRKEDTYICH